MSTSYVLMDNSTDNLLGTFRSEATALRAVAATAQRFGQDSPEVLSLMLFRENGPVEDGFIAEGEVLVRLALDASAVAPSSSATVASPGANQSRRLRRSERASRLT